ncbi:alkaline shock response membrane anchor protein AmaP [Amycolatopsis sp. A133]|uniref:alkaline shock response membrane anchor protein AmaP n=1 Tax=Amycolatopsis sp. A133 TaxID=3064472 RepID=UPI0027FDD090|nr:alkaline shock response membrane anchor protein AmaP [Amycolatopsis sp. A133]MDQ7810836.1 alkaline shock response membrane anchor protein AmaP [Amycolatopsis sp. A133]
MTDLNRPARLNRTLLILLGAALLAIGTFTLLTHFGRLPVLTPDSALLPETGELPTWSRYAAAAAAVITGLLLLRWLLAQLTRKPKTHTWRFEDDPARGRTELAAGTAITPFIDEVKGYAGVHNAHATLAGSRDHPAVALVISAGQDGEPAAIRRQLGTAGLPRLRHALGVRALPVTVEFRFSSETGARAR